MSEEVDALRDEVSRLRAQIKEIYDSEIESFHFSPAAQQDWSEVDSIPARGTSAATVQALIENAHALDFDQRLNTSSYVTVSFEPEEEAVALLGLGAQRGALLCPAPHLGGHYRMHTHPYGRPVHLGEASTRARSGHPQEPATRLPQEHRFPPPRRDSRSDGQP